ncbi:hypothetical protein WMF39_42365 [Sorangium sp. So ce1504]|uniref:hypothetical protein n=1 Tax=Sorangium sp. So ce1504 TaxID=3133337 RepID=UPI003F633E34
MQRTLNCDEDDRLVSVSENRAPAEAIDHLEPAEPRARMQIGRRLGAGQCRRGERPPSGQVIALADGSAAKPGVAPRGSRPRR